jgi:hypothetical protein
MHGKADFIHKGKKPVLHSTNAAYGTKEEIIGDPAAISVAVADVELSQKTANEMVPLAIVPKETVGEVSKHLRKALEGRIGLNKERNHTKAEIR